MVKYALYFAALLAICVGVWLSIVWDEKFGKAKPMDEPRDTAAASASGGPKGSGAAQSQAPVPDGFSKRVDDGLPSGNFEPTEVLVSNPPKSFENAVKEMGFTIIEHMSLGALQMDVFRLRIPPGNTVRTGVKLLRDKFPGVQIDANHQFDPSADNQAAAPATEPLLSYVRAAAGWGNVAADCGRDVRIGMIDGVVQTKHPALRGQKIEFQTFHREDRRVGPADHGTAIAAMLVGKPSDQGLGGIYPGATLYAANMFEYDKEGRLVGSAGALLKALNWMAENRVHVVNVSLAGENNQILRSAIDKATAAGLVIVAAAGNWGRADRPAYPAAYPEVIAVTAFGDQHAVYDMANSGTYIDFAAPGVKMWTAVPGGGRYQSGTSFATPYIAALTADLVYQKKLTTAAAVIDILKKDAVDMGVAGKDPTYGWGFVARAPACK